MLVPKDTSCTPERWQDYSLLWTNPRTPNPNPIQRFRKQKLAKSCETQIWTRHKPL